MSTKGGIRLIVTVGVALLFSGLAFAKITPNDPYYRYQSALFLPSSSSPDSTIADSWSITSEAPSVIVAVIDTGAEMDHPDLFENLWINFSEIPGNGLDDDGNGYADDIHGYDFARDDGLPEDEWGHGTMTAGIIGAVGNNSIGTAGVAWSVQLMILKVFGEEGEEGEEKNFASAIRYAVANGAQIISAAWTLPPVYPGDTRSLLKEAVLEAGEENVLLVTAAGNDAQNLDDDPLYPAAYPFDHVVSVAALGEDGELLENSNYGADSVLVAMGGDSILAPALSHRYDTLTGTSASTALVSGVAALMLSARTDLTAVEIADILATASDPAPSLDGVVYAGGRINPLASLSKAVAIESGNEEEDSPPSGAEPSSASSPAAAGCSLVRE